MFNISFGEILIFAIIALIILGPEKFPLAVRSAMQKYQKLKTSMNNIQQQFEHELELIELKQLMHTELERIKHSEQELKATLAKMQQELDDVQNINTPMKNNSQIKYTLAHFNAKAPYLAYLESEIHEVRKVA